MRKVLVANRGEIAVRVMRACREAGLATVAVHSDADRDALFVRYADEALCIGAPPAAQSYLRVDKLIEAAQRAGADALHPGYGFLAENPRLPEACRDAGIAFIGPSSEVLQAMGNKVAARRRMRAAGVPVVPGTEAPVTDDAQAEQAAAQIGYPVVVKPSGGGGGIGITVVHDASELRGALERSRKVAGTAFAAPEVYLEKYLRHPRHIEIQVLGDSHGNVIHLGERECSIQRRYQKLIEEAPSPAVTPQLRAEMGAMAATAARAVGYEGAGTIEMLFSEGRFYFLEMNTRIQVEHPVTELVTGVDIVKEQLRIASGLPLGIPQEEVRPNGWAIECRINAEDPLNGFAPSPGRVQDYLAPGGPGVRVDSGVYGGYAIPPFYDSMIAKLLTWGRDRAEAIARMRRALFEFVITGVRTNIAFHCAVMDNPRFVAGALDTGFLERETALLDDVKAVMERRSLEAALPRHGSDKARIAAVAAAAAVVQLQRNGQGGETGRRGGGLT